MPSQQVRVSMLGGFEIEVDGVAVPASVWRLKKARSLVKLLALSEGNSMHRDAVVDALWPGLKAASGTNNLHQVLHAARRALAVAGASDDLLRLRDGIVALCPGGSVTTDVGDLEKELAPPWLPMILIRCWTLPRGVLTACFLKIVMKTGHGPIKITSPT